MTSPETGAKHKLSDQITAEGAETAPEAANNEQNAPKPTETVDFWKSKAREQEKRAKENADAARELATLKDAQKSDAERAAEQLAKAQADIAAVPAKVAEELRGHLIELHSVSDQDAELFLTATDTETLLKQVARLTEKSDKRQNRNVVPREGTNHSPGTNDTREFTRQLFGRGD